MSLMFLAPRNYVIPVLPSDPEYDLYWDNVILLVHADGLDNGTSIIDSSTSAVALTASGGAVTSTTSPKFGAASLKIANAGSYVSGTIPALGAGDFTVEFWFRPDAVNTAWKYALRLGTLWSTSALGFGLYNMSQILITQDSSYSSVNYTFNAGEWYHVAIVKAGAVKTVYINGVNVYSGADTNNYTSTALTFGSNVSSVSLISSMDEIRITKGVARYTANFSVLSNTFASQGYSILDPYWNNTVLLMHMDGADNSTVFIDETGKALTVAKAGTGNLPKLSTAVKQFGTASGLFDSYSYPNGACAQTPNDGAFDFDTSVDFTIECWFNTSVSVTRNLTLAGTYQWAGGYLGGWAFTVSATNSLRLSANVTISTANNVVPVGSWVHLAVARNGSTTYFFVNGILVYSTTASINMNRPASGHPQNLRIGSIITDGGIFEWGLSGRLDDLRITRGIARYTANFSVPTETFTDASGIDYYWDNMVLLMHMDGANDGTVFTEETGRPVTRYGTPKTIESTKKFGLSSGYFDGNNSYLTVPPSDAFNFGTGDFTLETFIYWDGTYDSSGRIIFATGGSGSLDQFGIFSSGLLYGAVYGGYPPINVWTHVAATRKSGILRLFIDGVKTAETSVASSIGSSVATAFIGRRGDGFHPFKGYIEELRITKGVARYTDNFTVPTQQFIEPTVDPYWAYTSLAVRANGTDGSTLITDEKGTALTLNGGIALSTAQKKFGLSSVFFDGSNDYLQISSDPKFNNFGTGDFTIEMWVYPTNLSSDRALVSCINGWPSTVAYQFEIRTNGDLRFFAGNSLPISIASGTGAIVVNTWTHVAVSRKNGSTKMFINGTQYGSTHVGSVNINLATTCYIGFTGYYSEARFIGYMDDLRITKGAARYTGNFVPRNSEMLLG